MTILSKISGMIKYGYVSLVKKDTDYYQLTQVTYQERAVDVHVIYPYGLAGNLPTNSLVLTFSVNGDPTDLAGIGNDPENRFKGLKEGEVQVGSPVYKQYIKFDNSGSISIQSEKDVEITAPNLIDISCDDVIIKSESDLTLTSGNDVNIDSQNNITLDAIEDVVINAKHFILNASISSSISIGDYTDILTISSDSQTIFTLTYEPADINKIDLFLNGVKYVDFSVSGTTLTWNDPCGITTLTTDELIAKYWYAV